MKQIENVIAERNVIFKYHDGEIINCCISIGAPYKSEFGFSCPFIIGGFKDSKVRAVHGEDSLEALTTAYSTLNTLYNIYQRNGRFFLDETDTVGDDSILPRDLYHLED